METENKKGYHAAQDVTYVLIHDRLGRKGQRCRILPPTLPATQKLAKHSPIVMVEFEDGYKTILSRMAIRRDYGKGTATTATGNGTQAGMGPRRRTGPASHD